MSRKANVTIIGGFVVGAAALAVAAVIIFGGNRLFSKRPMYVMHFEGSVKGLDVGAPAMFRGVKVGHVKSISIKGEPDGKTFRIPVIVEINPHAVDSDEAMRENPEQELEHLIEQGLRAKLGIQSLVTGKLLVELGFFPDEKPRMVGDSGKYAEVPTIPSTFEKISQTVQNIPIQDIFNRLSASLKGIERIVNSTDIADSIKNLNQMMSAARRLVESLDERTERVTHAAVGTLGDAQSLLHHVDEQVEPIAGDTKTALRSANQALIRVRKTLTLEKGIQRDVIVSIKEMAEAIKKTADAARPAIAVGEKALENIGTLTAKDSNANYRIQHMLKELSLAARAIRIWAEYLERHPEALIRGKGSNQRR
jgi:paraquat-inducible protein B